MQTVFIGQHSALWIQERTLLSYALAVFIGQHSALWIQERTLLSYALAVFIGQHSALWIQERTLLSYALVVFIGHHSALWIQERTLLSYALVVFYRTTFSTMHTKKNTVYALVFSSCLPSAPAFFPKHSETRNKYDKSNNRRHSTDDQHDQKQVYTK